MTLKYLFLCQCTACCDAHSISILSRALSQWAERLYDEWRQNLPHHLLKL